MSGPGAFTMMMKAEKVKVEPREDDAMSTTSHDDMHDMHEKMNSRLDLSMRNCPKMDKLKSERDFLRWSKQMELACHFMGVHEYITKAKHEIRDWNMRAAMFTTLVIQQNLSDTYLNIVMDETDPHRTWTKIEEHCKGNVLQERTMLMQQLDRFQFSTSESMEKEVARFRKLTNNLRGMGVDIEDYNLIQRVLTALPSTFNDFKMHRRYNPMNEEIECFLYSVRAEAVRLRCWSKAVKKKQSASYYAGRGRGRGIENGDGRQMPNGGRGRGGIQNAICFRCWEKGHFQKSCTNAARYPPKEYEHLRKYSFLQLPTPSSRGNENEIDANENANDDKRTRFALSSISTSIHGSIREHEELSCEQHNDCFIIGVDSCAGAHLFKDKALFTTLKEMELPLHTTGIDSDTLIATMGGTVHICVTNNDGKEVELMLNDVYYCPDAVVNLISVPQMSRRTGGGVVFGHDSYAFTRNNVRMFDVHHQAGIYLIHATPIAVMRHYNFYAKRKEHERTQLWHQRLGHTTEKILKRMEQDGMIQEYTHPIMSTLEFCDMCLQGKQATTPFRKQHTRERPSTNHYACDLTGPFSVESYHKHLYGMVFMELETRFLFGSTLKHKSEFPQQVLQWIRLIEKQLNKKILSIRSDSAAEMKGHAFIDALKAQGVIQIINVGHAHQQNAQTERVIRTIMDMTRTFLFTAKLPMYLWDYAFKFAVHVYNRRHHSAIDATPYERFLDEKPRLDHMRVFGAFCHVMTPLDGRNKLQKRSVLGRLVGYHADSADLLTVLGYKVYIPSTKKVITVRNVKFDEQPILDNCRTYLNDFISAQPKHPVIPIACTEKEESSKRENECSETLGTNKRIRNDQNDNKSIDDSDKLSTHAVYSECGDTHENEWMDTNERNTLRTHEQANDTERDMSGTYERMNENTRNDTRIHDRLREQERDDTRTRSTNQSERDETRTHGDRKNSNENDMRSFTSALDYMSDELQIPIGSDNDDHETDETDVSVRRSTRQPAPRDHTAPLVSFFTRMRYSPAFAAVCHFALLENDPKTWKEALARDDADKWIAAAQVERDALAKFDTWDIVDRPTNKTVLPHLLVYKIKKDKNGSIDKYKVRCVARGDMQTYGIDFIETFAPVISFPTIRILLAIAASRQYDIMQMDVKSAYLNGKLDEPVYMEIPTAFYPEERSRGKVFKLKRSLYGLRQAGKIWNDEIHSNFIRHGLKSCSQERSLYVNADRDDFLAVGLFVDDILFTGPTHMLIWFRDTVMKEYDVDDRGELDYFLGLTVERTQDKSIIVHQKQYADDVLKRSGHLTTRACYTPLPNHQKILRPKDKNEKSAFDAQYASEVGALMYLMLGTRPDLSFAIGQACRFVQNPSDEHRDALAHMMSYLETKKSIGLAFVARDEMVLSAYVDADWAGDTSDSRSTTGYIICLGSAPIVWRSIKQKCVAKSSCEAELTAMDCCLNDVLLMRNVMDFMGMRQPPTIIHVDNKSALDLAVTGKITPRSKYFRVRTDAIKEAIDNDEILLRWVKTEEQKADMFTKSLSGPRLMHMMNEIRLVHCQPSEGV